MEKGCFEFAKHLQSLPHYLVHPSNDSYTEVSIWKIALCPTWSEIGHLVHGDERISGLPKGQ